MDRGRGVITDPAVWAAALVDVMGALAGAGATIMGAMASPLTGADGNVEFLVAARRAPVAASSAGGPAIEDLARVAVASVPAPAPDGGAP